MRLFVAINFSAETRSQLIAFRDELRLQSVSGNFSLDENLHLTLAFLGECGREQVIAAKRVLNAVKFEPFNISIAGGGYLDKGRQNLVFCGLKNDVGINKLQRLQFELSTDLSVKGFMLDRRKFWPHITLGREVVWKNTGDQSNFMHVNFPTIEERVSCIDLMKSERINGKLTYTPIFTREAARLTD